MLNALSVALSDANADGTLRAAKLMARQEFVDASRTDWPGGSLYTWSHPGQVAVENCEVKQGADTAACVGPLWYRGKFGRAALRLVLDDVRTSGLHDETALRGNFALFLRAGDRCLLFNDLLGLVRVYASADGLFYSTSWLATCAYTGRAKLHEAAAIEYVLLGASHSTQTVAQGVTSLPLAHGFDLVQRCPVPRLRDDAWLESRVPASFELAVDEIHAHLQVVFRETASAFPGRVRAALSGGFDSRLIVGGLLACKIVPELFVYGAPQSLDATVACAVADSEGIPLQVIDKQVLERELPAPNLERLVRNGLFFDGLPNDGIYDSGVDANTRMDQTTEGRLALNGGGGEIFRNYFHLPDRPFRAIDIVRSFYRGFSPGVFRRRDELSAYKGRLASSIERTLGGGNPANGRMLRRTQIELVYPLFRCHYWMAVNNSVAVRHGYYTTPLVDLKAIQLACRLPLAWKNAGRLESRLITRFHHGVADQSSEYDFRFSDGPNWRARFNEWTTCMRPVCARPLINATRRRLHKLAVAAEFMTRCRTLLPGDWQLDHVLDLAKLPDNTAFSRALAVEVAWRELLP
jgi:asparagine synthase (glutamine-hydrolysing)